MCLVDFSGDDIVDALLSEAVDGTCVLPRICRSDPFLVVFDDFVVIIDEYRSKEANYFSVCWDFYGTFLEVILKLHYA